MKCFSEAGLLGTLQAIKRDRQQAFCFKIICKCGSEFKLKLDSFPGIQNVWGVVLLFDFFFFFWQ